MSFGGQHAHTCLEMRMVTLLPAGIEMMKHKLQKRYKK
jgi:hypothetical protein